MASSKRAKQAPSNLKKTERVALACEEDLKAAMLEDMVENGRSEGGSWRHAARFYLAHKKRKAA